MIIFEGDVEGVKEWKRRANIEEMQKEHQWGALSLPLGIPIDCKVEQPRAQLEHISTPTYIQGDTQFINGEVRNVYFNGINRKEIAWGFAGRARTEGEMNGGEGEEHQWD